MACRRALLSHGSILLRHLIHLIDGDVHFREPGRLPLRRGRDLGDGGRNLAHVGDDTA